MLFKHVHVSIEYWVTIAQSALTQLLALMLIFGTMWGMLQGNALPGSPLFSLMLLMVWCNVGGRVAALMKLPSLIGMLFMGFVYRNFVFPGFYEDISIKWAATLRNASLVVILLRAGLGLDPKILKKLSYVCLRLSVLPCLVEAVTISVLSYYLFRFPWALNFCLGFILSGLSPAIIVPTMLNFEKLGYGKENGITTLIIASSSLDDVIAITGIGISIGIAFSKSSLAFSIIKGPLEVIAGLTYGVALGVLLWFFPQSSNELKTFYRIILLTFGGLAAYFVSVALNVATIGALGSLSLGFVVALKWRQESDQNASVLYFEDGLWIYLQTFLFGLIGAEVSVDDLRRDVGSGLLILLIGIIFRLIVTYLVLIKSGFNLKEKIFVCLCWIPKATVQAAMGSIVLDYARTLQLETNIITYGKQILTVAVLAIMITAPIGALAITWLAPSLLKRIDASPAIEETEPVVSAYGSCSTVTENNVAEHLP